MLTLHQFLAYCQRNDIQTVQYNQTYNYMSDTTDLRINLLTEEHRYEFSASDYCCDTIISCVNPEDFYRWYIDTYNSDHLEYVVRSHMRSKCPRRAFFYDDCLPF